MEPDLKKMFIGLGVIVLLVLIVICDHYWELRVKSYGQQCFDYGSDTAAGYVTKFNEQATKTRESIEMEFTVKGKIYECEFFTNNAWGEIKGRYTVEYALRDPAACRVVIGEYYYYADWSTFTFGLAP